MKSLLGLLIAALLLVGGFYAFNNYIYNEKQGDVTRDMNTTQPAENDLKFTPISHASLVLTLNDQVIYNDPVGGGEAFATQSPPNIILISDIHGDHLDAPTLKEITKEGTIIVVPQAVADLLPNDMSEKLVIMRNGETTTQKGILIEAVPMYNMPESEDARHTKGRGNGYVLSAEGKRVYLAGDTAATPEMKALQNIDVAFVPMNLPFTMGVEEAAEGVLAFKPKIVHPYHYRGQDGLADIEKFKELVNAGDPNIRVELVDFYPGE